MDISKEGYRNQKRILIKRRLSCIEGVLTMAQTSLPDGSGASQKKRLGCKRARA